MTEREQLAVVLYDSSDESKLGDWEGLSDEYKNNYLSMAEAALAHTTERVKALEADLEAETQRRRRYSSIVTHWQKHSAALGKILGCGSMDEDVTEAVIRLQADRKALEAERDGLQKRFENSQNCVCSYCREWTMREGRSWEEFSAAIQNHMLNCEKRPEKEMLVVISALAHLMAVNLEDIPKRNQRQPLIEAFDVAWQRICDGRDVLVADRNALAESLRRLIHSRRMNDFCTHDGEPDICAMCETEQHERMNMAQISCAVLLARFDAGELVGRPMWKCACGWSGKESALLPSPSSALVCPSCGASGGLISVPEIAIRPESPAVGTAEVREPLAFHNPEWLKQKAADEECVESQQKKVISTQHN